MRSWASKCWAVRRRAPLRCCAAVWYVATARCSTARAWLRMPTSAEAAVLCSAPVAVAMPLESSCPPDPQAASTPPASVVPATARNALRSITR